MANLEFRYGAMNSGKSTELIQVAYNYREQGRDVFVVKPVVDSKGGNTIKSRALPDPLSVDLLVQEQEMALREKIMNAITERAVPNVECVLADEAQFFTPTQIDDLLEIAKLDNLPVLAYGLRTDFQRNGFPGSIRLLELADKFQERTTICRCMKKARHNGRKINGKFIFQGDQIVIDGDEVEYESLCGTCYLEEQAKSLAT